MGKLSKELIDEIEEICRNINSTTTSPTDKIKLYERLEEIYGAYFIELPNINTNIKGS